MNNAKPRRPLQKTPPSGARRSDPPASETRATREAPQKRAAEGVRPLLLVALTECIEQLASFSMPADRVMGNVVKAYSNLTKEERQVLGQAAYSWLRQKRSFELYYPAQSPRRWALAALYEFARLGEPMLKSVGSSGDHAWLRERIGAPRRALTAAENAQLPDWLWERLVQIHGEAQASALAVALNAEASLDIRVNPLALKREHALQTLSAEGLVGQATAISPYGIRLSGRPNISRTALFEQGLIEVQDEGSQLIALLLQAKRGEMVADFCAGAGGKSLLIGAQMAGAGRLYAIDVDERRLKNLAPRIARAGLSNVQPLLIDHENDARVKRLAGKMDRVLVDAPCSGLGTLRRNPDLKWRQTPESVAEMTVKQASILRSAARLVKPGGRLVYATCSLLPEENEGVVEGFLSDPKNSEFTLTPVNDVFSSLKVDYRSNAETMHLSPLIEGCDGFYAAVLTRQNAAK